MSGEHRAERFQTEQELGNMQMQLTQTEDRAVSEGRRVAEQELGRSWATCRCTEDRAVSSREGG